MKATAEIQAIPLGAGVSVRREVQRAHELLKESGLLIETHASGTNEGDLSQILQAMERVH
ncbi:MAG: thiamine-binding protein, partial [Singulisphaera sp.]|nr:thiamine-binding protein [Singulisphaera sp.]